MNNLQHISQEEFEMIERYLNSELSEIELADFEVKLKHDSTFNAKVEDIKTILLGIETRALKDELNTFHDSINNEEPHKETVKVRTIHWKRIAAAAIVVIAAGSFWWLNTNTHERLYTKYFSPDPGLPTTMSSNNNYAFYNGMVSYKQGNYKSALDKWQPLLDRKPENDTLNYFIGIAHMANNNEAQAISYLQNVSKLPNSRFHNDAYYYLALAYLKANDIENAVKALKASNSENSKDLLKKIN